MTDTHRDQLTDTQVHMIYHCNESIWSTVVLVNISHLLSKQDILQNDVDVRRQREQQ